MPKWGEYDKVEPTPDVDGDWFIAGMTLSSGRNYVLDTKITQSIEETLVAAIDNSCIAKPRLITISYSDGSEVVLRFRENIFSS
jgi:hypothetical protein